MRPRPDIGCDLFDGDVETFHEVWDMIRAFVAGEASVPIGGKQLGLLDLLSDGYTVTLTATSASIWKRSIPCQPSPRKIERGSV